MPVGLVDYPQPTREMIKASLRVGADVSVPDSGVGGSGNSEVHNAQEKGAKDGMPKVSKMLRYEKSMKKHSDRRQAVGFSRSRPESGKKNPAQFC